MTTSLRTVTRRTVVPRCLTALLALLCSIGVLDACTSSDTTSTANIGAIAWPQQGQAAVEVSGRGLVGTSGSHRAVPIASVAKVMTAYVVLTAAPLTAGADGFTVTITGAQARDTRQRRKLDQSLVAVRVGERLTERQALEALLLPSANNIAAILAQHVSGSQERFVQRMNDQARALGMRDTGYTDPSGYLDTTVSTATDQLLLARAAMRLPAFAEIVAQRSATLPVAGTVHNTNRLLGIDGFVGLKTGSHDAAGGCFVFVSVHQLHGRTVVVTGVVLGQRSDDLVGAALQASRRLVDSVLRDPASITDAEAVRR